MHRLRGLSDSHATWRWYGTPVRGCVDNSPKGLSLYKKIGYGYSVRSGRRRCKFAEAPSTSFQVYCRDRAGMHARSLRG